MHSVLQQRGHVQIKTCYNGLVFLVVPQPGCQLSLVQSLDKDLNKDVAEFRSDENLTKAAKHNNRYITALISDQGGVIEKARNEFIPV